MFQLWSSKKASLVGMALLAILLHVHVRGAVLRRSETSTGMTFRKIEQHEEMELPFESETRPRKISRRLQDGALQCYDALIFSDTDYNRQVNKTEYMTFLDLYGPPDFLPDGTETFNDLPLVLKSNFLILACLCLQQPDADPNCCVGDAAHISNLGAAPDEVPTTEQETSLFQVCFLTETSIDRYVETITPTETPAASPSIIPTLSPSVTASDNPTVEITVSPSLLLTTVPTLSPSLTPSTDPTAQATFPPSPGPTAVPSQTDEATPSPSNETLIPSGTFAPTVQNTTSSPSTDKVSSAPTPDVASSSPSSLPSTKPSDVSSSPTSSPTLIPAVNVVAQTTYIIAIQEKNGEPADEKSYEADLRAAMDMLAPQVAINSTLGSRRLQKHLRYIVRQSRRLQGITVDLPTSVDGRISTVCPENVAEGDRCEDVSASINLLFDNPSNSLNASVVRESFEASLAEAIERGDLQRFLTQVNANSSVYIVTSGIIDPPEEDDELIDDDDEIEDRSLSGGAISGIVVGSMAGVILAMGLLSRRKRNDDDEEYYLKENQSADVEELIAGEDQRADDQGPPTLSPEDSSSKATADALGPATAAAAIGAVYAVSEAQKDKEPQKMDSPAAVTSFDKQDSDAGSSGWSSREGMSSLESSADDETKSSSRGGAVSTAVSASQSQTLASSAGPENDPGMQMTYSELDQAIQKGDWAAVGVTAALLASQSHGSTQDSPDKKVNFQRDSNSSRAQELDRLVEAGDWAGVVAAAAKYDAAELQSGSSSVRSDSRTSEAESSAGSVGSAGTGPSAHSGSGTALTAGSGAFTSGGTTTSDTNSRVKKLDEIRAEVEQLVEKVVPEERDNIDEMLMQFRGREEELVETLRTMQEREVAQKARLEGQKRAKRDARQAVEQNKHNAPAASIDNTEEADSPAEPADENWISEIENTNSSQDADEATTQEDNTPRLEAKDMEPPREEDEENEVKAMQNALKAAIDSEDWEKVAEAAAGLSGRFLDDSPDNTASDSGSSDSDKSREINALVDKGDWDGVVAAASKYTENERSVSTGDSAVEERRAKRERRLKEEQEALEQADIWNAIAEQTRNDNSPSESEAHRAATVAADWAIARSLSELKAADKAGKLQEEDAGSGSSTTTDDDQEGAI